MTDTELTPNQQHVQDAFSATLKVDMYATTISTWADLTEQQKLDVQPFMPTFPVHYENAKKHARDWTMNIRPNLVESVVTIQGVYDDFKSATSPSGQANLRAQMNILKDASATREQKEAAMQTLREGLDDIIESSRMALAGEASLGIVGAKDVLIQLEQFAANANADIERLYSDYQDLQNLTADRKRTKDELDQAQLDLEADKAAEIAAACSTIIGALAFVGGICLTIGGAMSSPLTNVGGAVAVGVGITLMGTGGAALVGGAISWKAAVDRKERDQARVDTLTSDLDREDAAIAGASVLANQGTFLAQSMQDVRESMDVLIAKYRGFPEELRRIRDDAAKAKTQDEIAQLDDNLTQLAQDYGDLNDSLQSLLNALTTLTVEVDGAAKSSIRPAA